MPSNPSTPAANIPCERAENPNTIMCHIDLISICAPCLRPLLRGIAAHHRRLLPRLADPIVAELIDPGRRQTSFCLSPGTICI